MRVQRGFNRRIDRMEEAAFPDLYYKRWPVETKYQQVKQKLELENFSGRLVDHIKQDFYAMMTVSNMLSSGLREANAKRAQGQTKKRQYAYRANVDHAVGVLNDRLIGILIAKDIFVRQFLYGELVSEIKRRVVPIRPNREVPRKEYGKSRISPTTTNRTVERDARREQAPAVRVA